MRLKHATAKAALPTAEGVKPKLNATQKGDPARMEALLLLKQIIVEAKSFRRPDRQERQDGER